MRRFLYSVTVAGRVLPVILDTDLEEHYGQFDRENLQITVSQRTVDKPKLLKETVRHEVFHACLYLSGLSFALSDELEEQIVRMADGILWDAAVAAEKSRRQYARSNKSS